MVVVDVVVGVTATLRVSSSLGRRAVFDWIFVAGAVASCSMASHNAFASTLPSNLKESHPSHMLPSIANMNCLLITVSQHPQCGLQTLGLNKTEMDGGESTKYLA